LNTFRLINKIEKSIINNSLLKFSSEVLSYFKKKDYRFYIFINDEQTKNKFPLIYLVPYEISNFLEEKLKNENINAAGIYFGFIKKGIFHLSLEGAEFFLNKNIIPNQFILIVTNKGEKAILYGNPIIKKMVFNIPSDLQKKAILLVLNESRKLIALARSEIDYSNYNLLNQEDLVAKNLIDKGYYLRKKQ